MIKKEIKIAFLFLLITATCFARKLRRGDKPNIIFILVDDMGWNGLSSYGNKHVTTPNIDRLAKQGMKFTQAYVTPECTPTRAEFLSGQYGARTGITEVHANRVYPNAPLITPKAKENKLPADNYTIANMMRDAGYTTMISGKWHVGDAYRAATLKKKYGDSYFKPYGFDYIGDAIENKWDEVDKDKASMDIVEDFFQFIGHNPKPFFAYLPFFSPHTPIDAPDSLIQKFVDRGYPRSTNRFGDATQKPTADYLAMIKYLDYAVGSLLDRLDATGLSKGTMIVFMSDNGALNRDWDNCPLRGAKGVTYEGGIRVPLLVRWPGKVLAGSETDTPVDIVDMYTTFKEIAGGSMPETKVLDGKSLVPLLTCNRKEHREILYWHHPQYIHDYGQTPSSAIRQGNFKLIHYYGDYLNTTGYLPRRGKPYGELELGEKIELFNIKEDPYEQHDLFRRNPQKAQDLLGMLNKWLMNIKASTPRRNLHMNMSSWYKTRPKQSK